MLKYTAALLLILLFFTFCNQNKYTHGRIMYENFCASCHIEDGTGLKGNIPPLAKADFLHKYPEKLPCIIRYGIQEEIDVNGATYHQAMEGIPQLTDVEIANIINYINHAWGNDNGYTSIKDVQANLKNCKKYTK